MDRLPAWTSSVREGERMTFVRRYGIFALGSVAIIVGLILAAIDNFIAPSPDTGLAAYPSMATFLAEASDGGAYDDAPGLWIALGGVLIVLWISLARFPNLTDRAPVVRALGAFIIGTALIVVGSVMGASPYFPYERPPAGVTNINAFVEVNEGPIAFAISDPHAIASFGILLVGILLVSGAVGYAIAKRAVFRAKAR
jgi:hypothetical protein